MWSKGISAVFCVTFEEGWVMKDKKAPGNQRSRQINRAGASPAPTFQQASKPANKTLRVTQGEKAYLEQQVVRAKANLSGISAW